jgi:hypothetical protein
MLAGNGPHSKVDAGGAAGAALTTTWALLACSRWDLPLREGPSERDDSDDDAAGEETGKLNSILAGARTAGGVEVEATGVLGEAAA